MLTLKPVLQFGEFRSPLRNIRLRLDETSLEVDLIESVSINRWFLEEDRMLHLAFERAYAVKIHEEFSDPDLNSPQVGAPSLPGGGIWPLCEVIGSAWQATFGDDCVAGRAGLKHFKIWSMETAIDVIGREPTGEWLRNPRARENR